MEQSEEVRAPQYIVQVDPERDDPAPLVGTQSEVVPPRHGGAKTSLPLTTPLGRGETKDVTPPNAFLGKRTIREQGHLLRCLGAVDTTQPRPISSL